MMLLALTAGTELPADLTDDDAVSKKLLDMIKSPHSPQPILMHGLDP
jgi:hypothetical protein